MCTVSWIPILRDLVGMATFVLSLTLALFASLVTIAIGWIRWVDRLCIDIELRLSSASRSPGYPMHFEFSTKFILGQINIACKRVHVQTDCCDSVFSSCFSIAITTINYPSPLLSIYGRLPMRCAQVSAAGRHCAAGVRRHPCGSGQAQGIAVILPPDSAICLQCTPAGG